MEVGWPFGLDDEFDVSHHVGRGRLALLKALTRHGPAEDEGGRGQETERLEINPTGSHKQGLQVRYTISILSPVLIFAIADAQASDADWLGDAFGMPLSLRPRVAAAR